MTRTHGDLPQVLVGPRLIFFGWLAHMTTVIGFFVWGAASSPCPPAPEQVLLCPTHLFAYFVLGVPLMFKVRGALRQSEFAPWVKVLLTFIPAFLAAPLFFIMTTVIVELGMLGAGLH